MNKAERDRLRIQPTTHPGTVVMRSKDMLSLLDTCDALEAEIADRKDCEQSSAEWILKDGEEIQLLRALCREAAGEFHPFAYEDRDLVKRLRAAGWDSTNESNTQPKEDL